MSQPFIVAICSTFDWKMRSVTSPTITWQSSLSVMSKCHDALTSGKECRRQLCYDGMKSSNSVLTIANDHPSFSLGQ
jgi:hypothetical protein